MFLNSTLSTELVDAYRGTDYTVYSDPRLNPFTLRVGHACEPLRSLLKEAGHTTAGFLTACNPGSEPLPESVNRQRQEELIQELQTLGIVGLPGIGRHPNGDWPAEPSVLAIGLDRLTADKLAERHGQNAYVWYQINESERHSGDVSRTATAELVLMR